jgi:hypothetical protein
MFHCNKMHVKPENRDIAEFSEFSEKYKYSEFYTPNCDSNGEKK